MIITDIRYGKNRKYEIYLNDEFAFELYKSEINAYHIEKEQELEDSVYQALIYEVIGKRAKKRAMHILEKNDKTEQQLREKLKENRYPAQSIESAIEYVKSYQYIDDRSYARRYIEYRSRNKSKKKLMMELYAKGISKDIIEEVFETVDVAEEIAIEKLILKKSKTPWELDSESKRKIIMSLVRKGFSYAQVERVFSTLEEQQGIREIT